MFTYVVFALAAALLILTFWRLSPRGLGRRVPSSWRGNDRMLVALSLAALVSLATFLLFIFPAVRRMLFGVFTTNNATSDPDIGLIFLGVGALLLFLGLVSDLLKRMNLSAPLLAMLLGVIAGPAVLDIVDPADWGNRQAILETAARLTLAISVMSAAQRLPKGYLSTRRRDWGVMLGIVMPAMWLASSLLIYLILGLRPWVALLVGAVLTPTDPVIASGIIGGELARRTIPPRLRHLLSAESGSNDGLAFLFIFLPLAWLSSPGGQGVTFWLVNGLGRGVLLAMLVGAALGFAAGWLLRRAVDRKTIEEPYFLASSLALTLLTLGFLRLLNSSAIVGVFVAGLVFNEFLTEREGPEAQRSIMAAEPFLTLPIFTLVGVTLPWSAWSALGWGALLLLVVAIFLLRRLPALLAVAPLLGTVERRADALFLGSMGPIGISALFYTYVVLANGPFEEVWQVASFVIAASILIHGLSATWLSRKYHAYRIHNDC